MGWYIFDHLKMTKISSEKHKSVFFALGTFSLRRRTGSCLYGVANYVDVHPKSLLEVSNDGMRQRAPEKAGAASSMNGGDLLAQLC